MNKFLIIFLLLFTACKNKKVQEEKKFPEMNYKEHLVEANKVLVKNEDDEIEALTQRYHWSMKNTGTGLRYMIYHNGNGLKAERGKVARIKFTVNLINGNPCYSSEKEFLIGKGGVESGVEEAILLLKVGDKAKLIIPSHLGFGLLGDQNKIPKHATLVYDIELLQLK